MAASIPQESARQSEFKNAAAKPPSTQEKLAKLASTPFAVMGEVQVTDDDIKFTILGEVAPEPRLGMAPNSFPRTLKEALEILHPNDRAPFEKGVAQSIATGNPFKMDYRLADGRGGWRWIEGQAVSVEYRDGKHVGWVFCNRDYTAQKESEIGLLEALEALKVSQVATQSEHDRLWKSAANAFSVVGEAILTDSGIDLTYFGDVPAEQKVGLMPGTVPKNSTEVLAMVHPDDVGSLLQAFQQVIATGVFQHIHRLPDGKGSWRWLQARAVSVEKRDGKHVRWLHDTIDITELKETEETLRRSLEELSHLKERLQSENSLLREKVEPGEIVGKSAVLARVLNQINLVAATSSTVLISGETGTGKELVARAIHDHSDRRKELFVAVNCAALPSSLVESELFGHEKGAFTGALARRIGRFEQADGGTLLLDEVGELPLETQAKLLRVLQSGEFERVGGNKTLKYNVRIIAATNRDLEQAVRDGRFRSDLYHRLSVFPIELPPLRERREDIPLLATYLAVRKAHQLGRHIEHISETILERLTAHDWPGNVRELENVLERAIILSPGTSLRLEAVHLGSPGTPKTVSTRSSFETTDERMTGESLEARERAHIIRVCESTAWKIKGSQGAAARLSINPGTLYSRMKKLGIRRPQTTHLHSQGQ